MLKASATVPRVDEVERIAATSNSKTMHSLPSVCPIPSQSETGLTHDAF